MSPKVAAFVRKLKKYHKWPGIFVAFFALLFALSGIILNHRNLISNVDISRKWMPPGYRYKNWNLAGVRSSLSVGKDSILIYGNIGVWMTTDGLTSFTDWNNGFPDGIDKRKIYSLVKYRHRLVAGTHFGLYVNTLQSNKWVQLRMPEGEERISDLAVRGDTLLILTRNFLYRTTDLLHIEGIKLPSPEGYDHKAGLFLTLWELHSGELFGIAGTLFVDMLGLVLIFLSVTGLLHFLLPKLVSRLKKQGGNYTRPLSIKKWNLKWHNLIGYIFVAFLLVNTTAGMFLRPPLLIPIYTSQVGVLPYSHLDTDNPWHDKLRRIIWDSGRRGYVLYTSDGFFYADQNLRDPLCPVPHQPQVSIMGCNTLELLEDGSYLVGSFSGLFVWHPATGVVLDYFTGQQAESASKMGRPVGQNMVAGYLRNCHGRDYWIDYNRGIMASEDGSSFPEMPETVLKQTPISLWNAALEVHTGRIFENQIGPFYLLYVPLMGLTILIVLISGIVIWWLGYRKR